MLLVCLTFGASVQDLSLIAPRGNSVLLLITPDAALHSTVSFMICRFKHIQYGCFQNRVIYGRNRYGAQP